MRKLKDPAPSIEKFFAAANALREKLGPILFQLPPHWKRDSTWLREFLAALPRCRRYTFEFREPSWFHAETYALLEKYNASLCVYDLAGWQSPQLLTADFAYLRLHGPTQQKYAGRYSPDQLHGWLTRCKEWLATPAQRFSYTLTTMRPVSPR